MGYLFIYTRGLGALKLMTKKDELLMANQFNVFYKGRCYKSKTVKWGFEENS